MPTEHRAATCTGAIASSIWWPGVEGYPASGASAAGAADPSALATDVVTANDRTGLFVPKDTSGEAVEPNDRLIDH